MKTTAFRPVNALLIVGPTGSGKSPLGEHIASRGFLGRRSHHLDFGCELRAIVAGIDSSSYSRKEHEFIIGVLEHGLLLENNHFPLAEKIIRRFLDRSRFCSDDLLILNGIPRHLDQARDISSIASVLGLVILDCSVSSVFCRIKENTGGDREGRTDDDFLLIEKKISIFNARTVPLIEYYTLSGTRIYRLSINDKTSTDSAYHQLSSLASSDPPVTFIAEPPQR